MGLFSMSTGRWERSRCRIRRFSALYTWRASDVGCIPDTASSYNKNGMSTPFFSFTISDTCTTAQITLWDMPFEPEKYVDHAVAVFRNCTVSDYKKDTNGMSLNAHAPPRRRKEKHRQIPRGQGPAQEDRDNEGRIGRGVRGWGMGIEGPTGLP